MAVDVSLFAPTTGSVAEQIFGSDKMLRAQHVGVLRGQNRLGAIVAASSPRLATFSCEQLQAK